MIRAERHTMTDPVWTPLEECISASGRNYNTEKIRAAYDYAAQLHAGQMRQSGEPYISHPVAVAQIVVQLGLDTDSICAALLHDTVEDCADKRAWKRSPRALARKFRCWWTG